MTNLSKDVTQTHKNSSQALWPLSLLFLVALGLAIWTHNFLSEKNNIELRHATLEAGQNISNSISNNFNSIVMVLNVMQSAYYTSESIDRREFSVLVKPYIERFDFIQAIEWIPRVKDVRSIYGAEDFFEERVPGNDYTRHMLGMFLVGIMMYVLMVTQGHYYIQGVGYATVQDVLSEVPMSAGLLLLLFLFLH